MEDGSGKAKWWVSGIVAPVIAGLLIWYLTGSNSPFHNSNPSSSVSANANANTSANANTNTSAPANPRAAAGTVNVPQGYTLYVYSTPSLDATKIAQLADGVTVQIQCTAQGEVVTGNGQSSSLWDMIGVGYVPDVWVYTGTDQPTMPTC